MVTALVAIVLAVSAVVSAFWAFALKKKAEKATADALQNLNTSYRSDIKRLEQEIYNIERNLSSFGQYKAGEDVILYENNKKDSLILLRDSLTKLIQQPYK